MTSEKLPVVTTEKSPFRKGGLFPPSFFKRGVWVDLKAKASLRASF
jgi:hypothetical protein